MKKSCVAMVAGSALICSLAKTPSFSAVELSKDYVGVVKTLLELFDRQDSIYLSSLDIKSSALKDLQNLKTPAGFRLRLRLFRYGVSLVEALKVGRDPVLKKRMVELARWAKNPAVRSDALLAMAVLGDPNHEQYFKEAMADSNISIQFAVVEALQQWRQPAAVSLLKSTQSLLWSPLLKIFAAQALLSMGEKESLSVLWQGLDNPSWVVRAMSARYLGDYARPADANKIISYISRETPVALNQSNPSKLVSPLRDNRSEHVVAELCIAALKLISKHQSPVSYSPATPGWDNNDEVKYTLGANGVIELEPLLIVPPRLRIQSSGLISSHIDDSLVRIFQTYLDVPPDYIISSPNLEDLSQLTTPTGYALRLRYSPNLSYLLVEGLAGSNDLRLRSQLQKIFSESKNDDARASALISLAYDRNNMDWSLIQQALQDKNPVVRFGGMEAVEIGRFVETLPEITQIASGDSNPAFQVYASYLMAKFGQASGHSLLLSQSNNMDWAARAMAFWYLGRYGEPADYTLVLSRLGSEQNPFVKAEICLAALRLAPL